MPPSPSQEYRFDRFRLVPAERRLLEGQKPVKLGGRAFDTLLALVEQRERAVSKTELMERAWPGVIVEENNLQVQISALRKVLGQQAIATIPGRGYRFTLALDHVPVEAEPRPRPRSNIPQPLTSFVGRESDVVELSRLLEGTRLLTLTGIGGCGKTRLAIKLAETVAESFEDGVFLADLAAIAEPQRVPLCVAAALGLREETDKPIEETLVRHVSTRCALLVLDNCEHLLAVCATLAERLLTSSPRLRVVVTSREGVGIAGERVVPVRSLSVPSQINGDIGALLHAEAVQLFVERARDVAPDFELTTANAAAVVDICRRLDGIPLALELAAARVKLLSVEQIHARLHDRFRLLTGSSRMLSRHQTLLATLQWSYEHLAPEEQTWLRRLAVFAGGWTLESATAIVSDDRNEAEALDRLARLVDQSLVLVERGHAEAPRYRMLETVRQYAEDRLNESGEGETLRMRHLAYFTSLVREAHPHLFTAASRRWTERLDDELSNVLAAHAWCDVAPGLTEAGLDLASHLRLYWIDQGLFALGQQVYEEALARCNADARLRGRAWTLFALGQHLNFRGRFADAVAPLEQALKLARELGDDPCAGNCLNKIAYARAYIGDATAARACIEQELELRTRGGAAGDDLSGAFLTKAAVCRMLGDLEEATTAIERALSLCDRDNFEGRHVTLVDAARIFIAQGRTERALPLLIEAMRLLPDMASRYRMTMALDAASLVAGAFGDWQRAARLQGTFESTLGTMGGFQNPYDDQAQAKLRQESRSLLGEHAYAREYEAGRHIPPEQAFADAVTWLEQRAAAQA